LRRARAGIANADLVLADKLLRWLQGTWQQPIVSLPDIYQRGLNQIGDKATADLFMPDEDRHTYTEGLNRGGYLLSARVPEELADTAGAVLGRELF
jgi:hypothetical protein